MKTKSAGILLIVFFFQSAWSMRCDIFLGPQKNDQTLNLMQRDLLLKSLQVEDVTSLRTAVQTWVLGQGLEGVAKLRVYPTLDGYRTVVHKQFLPTAQQSKYGHLISLEGFRELRNYKKEGRLPGLEIAKVLGISEIRRVLYLEYIHGDSILNLTHQKLSETLGQVGPKYILRSDLSQTHAEVLNRFDRSLRQTAEIWARDAGVQLQRIEISVKGESKMVALIIKDHSGNKVMDLNILNTVYDIINDRLVIVDPY